MVLARGVAVLVAVAALGGCGPRATLTRTHGVSYRAAFAQQQAVPTGRKPVDPPPGLDSQEAAIIADGYRQSLAPKGQKTDQEPVILVAPQSSGARAQQLQPSVPK